MDVRWSVLGRGARAVAVLAVACVLAAAAHADAVADVGRCRTIKEPSERLACYDLIPVSAASDPAQAAVSGRQGADPKQTFGLPSHLPPPPVDAVESSIVGQFEGWEPNAQFRLANGQVWQVADDSRGVYSAVDAPKAKVVRGALDSFFLEIAGVRQSPRVRRVK